MRLRAFPSSGPVRRLWEHKALRWASEQEERALGLGKGKWLTTGTLSQRPRAQLVRTKVKSINKARKRGCSHNVLGWMNQEHPRGLMANRMVRTTPLGKILPGKYPRH